MTVISTLITRAGTVHATDSLLTELKPDGQREAIEWKKTKIVPVRAWRGAMSYYGLAQLKGYWSTLDWLREQSIRANMFGTAEEFARSLADALNHAIATLPIRCEVDRGIGIHFSAYEWVCGYWIPELFHISNWNDTTYRALRPTGVEASRDMYGTLSINGSHQVITDEEKRFAVYKAIQNGTWFRYNNGDPRLYNQAADGMHLMFKELARRGILRNPDNIETIRSLTRRPVEVVSNIQQDLCASGTRVVGGKIHDLTITPNGEYSSRSGDEI